MNEVGIFLKKRYKNANFRRNYAWKCVFADKWWGKMSISAKIWAKSIYFSEKKMRDVKKNI